MRCTSIDFLLDHEHHAITHAGRRAMSRIDSPRPDFQREENIGGLFPVGPFLTRLTFLERVNISASHRPYAHELALPLLASRLLALIFRSRQRRYFPIFRHATQHIDDI